MQEDVPQLALVLTVGVHRSKVRTGKPRACHVSEWCWTGVTDDVILVPSVMTVALNCAKSCVEHWLS